MKKNWNHRQTLENITKTTGITTRFKRKRKYPKDANINRWTGATEVKKIGSAKATSMYSVMKIVVSFLLHEKCTPFRENVIQLVLIRLAASVERNIKAA